MNIVEIYIIYMYILYIFCIYYMYMYYYFQIQQIAILLQKNIYMYKLH